MSVPRLPWFGWAIVAFFVLNVVLQRNVSILPLIILGVVLAGVLGGPSKRPRTGPGPTAGGQMPTIDVPTYPQGQQPPPPGPAASAPPGPSAYPQADPSTDPVVSLGRLHLGRCARELDTAARAGDQAEADRALAEIVDLTTRLQPMTDGLTDLPGSGRRDFASGLQRLQREALAARGEVPPGPRAAQVARGAAAISQTGRYE